MSDAINPSKVRGDAAVISPWMPELFSPTAASAYLAERWAISVSVKTLAKWRVIGGKIRYRTAGRNIVYEKAALDAWATSRLSTVDYGSTTEARLRPIPA